MTDKLSCIIVLRANGIDPFVDAILWPESQNPHAQAFLQMRARMNPGMVAAAVSFPEGTTREKAIAFLKNAPQPWLVEQYRRGHAL